jgi:hypothetical protein
MLIISFLRKSCYHDNPDYILLEIKNEEAFYPLIEALFPDREFTIFHEWCDTV